jgi:hypothetical protein
VFNADETGIFLNKMLRRMYVTKDEFILPAHKPMLDRLTLLLGSNTSGDLMLNTVLMYNSGNLTIFKQQNIIKGELGVFWKPNHKNGLPGSFLMNRLVKILPPPHEVLHHREQ